jgi:hypothetical protein
LKPLDLAKREVGRFHLPLIPFRHTINLARSFIFDYSGHFMPANTTDLEKRLWDAADDRRMRLASIAWSIYTR